MVNAVDRGLAKEPECSSERGYRKENKLNRNEVRWKVNQTMTQVESAPPPYSSLRGMATYSVAGVIVDNVIKASNLDIREVKDQDKELVRRLGRLDNWGRFIDLFILEWADNHRTPNQCDVVAQNASVNGGSHILHNAP